MLWLLPLQQWWINRKRHMGSFFIKNAAYGSVVDQASSTYVPS